VPAGNKTRANHDTLLRNNMSHSNSELIQIKKVLINLRTIHFTLSLFLNAVLTEWPMSDVTN